MIDLREFATEDWYCWGGAESGGDDKPPLINDSNDSWLVLADANGVEVHLFLSEGDEVTGFDIYTADRGEGEYELNTAFARELDPATFTKEGLLAQGFVFNHREEFGR